MLTDSSASGSSPVTVSCESGNETSVVSNKGNILSSDYYVVKKNSAL
jgi:hypothetical protein